MEKIPILKMGQFLLVTIQVDLYDKLVRNLEADLVKKISTCKAKGILIDISAVAIIDSFIGRILTNIASMGKILDAETVVVGMQPAVAITLVELGLTLKGVHTAINIEKGMNLLRTKIDWHDNTPPDENSDDITHETYNSYNADGNTNYPANTQ